MPLGLSIATEPFRLREAATSCREYAFFDPQTCTLHFDPRAPVWDEAERAILREASYLSTDHPHGTAYHEYAHFFVHHRHPVIDETLNLSGDIEDETLLELIESVAVHVSVYAARSALEFIAEVYAGLRTGRLDPHPEVLRVYNTLVAAVGPLP